MNDDKRFDWHWSDRVHGMLVSLYGEMAANPYIMETWWMLCTPAEKRAEIEAWNATLDNMA